MVLRIFKSLWFLSVMAVLASLLYVYASLPQEVVVQDDESGKIMVSREFFFYAVTALLAIVNVLVYVVGKMFTREEGFRAWFHGLIITLNVFVIIALMLFNVYNSNEKYDYSQIGFIIYGSIGLVVIWTFVWPFYSLFKKFALK